MGKECEVYAVVKEVLGDKITVETTPNKVCADCGAGMLCGSAKKNVFTLVASEFKLGDHVCLSMPAKYIFTVTFVLYAMGIAVGITVTILLSRLFGYTETAAAVCFLAAVTIWFIPVTILSGKSIKKQIKISAITTLY